MIRAWLFDLDGTLVQTERLKAQSYAQAAVELCPHDLDEEDVIEAFTEVVGRSRQEVAESLIERFQLGQRAADRMGEFGVSTPWQAFVQVRLRHYDQMISDPDVLRNNQWPHNVSLLRQAREAGCKTALITMSTCVQTSRVLDVLGLRDQFDFIATRDDVEQGKPNPEIYQLALNFLEVPAYESLAIEDSPSGVAAALAADVNVIAVATPFTHNALHQGGMLAESMIVDEPDELPTKLQDFMALHQQQKHSNPEPTSPDS